MPIRLWMNGNDEFRAAPSRIILRGFSGFVLAFPGLLGLLSCSPPSPDQNVATVRDSTGVAIVENRGPVWTERSRWRLSEQPLLVIGENLGDPDGQLWQVRGLARMKDGRIAVLNAGSQELRLFGTSGNLVARAGGHGGGPGEFDYPRSLTLLQGDTLVVLDRTGNRVFFEPQGRFLRQEVLDRGLWASFWGSGHRADFGGVLPDRSLLALVYEQGPPSTYPQGLYRPVMGLASVRPDFSDTTFFGWFAGIEQEAGAAGGVFSSVPPFAAYTSFGFGGDPARLVVADNDSYEVKIFGFTGKLERVVRKIGELESIQPAEVEAWKEKQRSMEWVKGQLPLLERAWADLALPEKKPAFEWAILDRQSNLWVLENAGVESGPLGFTVFDEKGQMLGQVSVPAGLDLNWYSRLTEIGSDYFLGIWRDQYDVETVRLYHLTKPMEGIE